MLQKKYKKMNKKEINRKKEAREYDEYIGCIGYNKRTFPINFLNFRAFFCIFQVWLDEKMKMTVWY